MDINSSPEEIIDEPDPPSRSQWSVLPLSLFTLCFYTAMMAQRSIIPQYIFERLLEENGLPASYSNSSVCHINKSDPIYQRREEIQAESSLILSKISIMEGVPQIIMVMIYGAYSDEMGRKLTILVPCFGAAVWSISASLMINLDLPFYTYYIGSVINGISGSFGTMLSGVFAYLADTTTKKQRTLAIGTLEASLGMSMVISNFAVGYWLNAAGPKAPSIGIACLLVVSPLFIFCVKESVPRADIVPHIEGSGILGSLKRQLKKMQRLFIANPDRGISLSLCVAAFSLHVFCALGGMNMLTLYALNEPFCWPSKSIGIYEGSKKAFWQCGMFLTLLMLRKRLSDWWIAYFAFISFICYNGITSGASCVDFPANDVMLFGAAASGVFVNLCAPMIRGICSKSVHPNEQGIMFAVIAAAETGAVVLGLAILNPIFGLSLPFFSGFVFVLMAFIEMIALGLLSAAHHVHEKQPITGGYSTL